MSNELPDIQPPPPPSGGYQQQPPAWQNYIPPSFQQSGSGGDASKDILVYIGLAIAILSLCAWILPCCGCPFSLVAIALGYVGLSSNQQTLAKVTIGIGGLTFVLTICSAIFGILNN